MENLQRNLFEYRHNIIKKEIQQDKRGSVQIE